MGLNKSGAQLSKTQWIVGVEVYLHTFLISVMDRGVKIRVSAPLATVKEPLKTRLHWHPLMLSNICSEGKACN
jgi:hypothetical protein